MNLKVLKCYKNLFTKKGLINNIGSYILLSIIFSQIILIINFGICGYNKFKCRINEIIEYSKVNKEKIIDPEKSKFNNDYIKSNKNKNIKNGEKNKTKKIKENKNKIKKHKRKKKLQINISNRDKEITLKSNVPLEIDIFKGNNKKDNYQNYNNYNDNELNNLIYEEALKTDKRTYFQYYASLIKIKHLIIFSFYTPSLSIAQ